MLSLLHFNTDLGYAKTMLFEQNSRIRLGIIIRIIFGHERDTIPIVHPKSRRTIRNFGIY
ncbi:hypothetical protein D3C71_2116270 [compost metagenome]